MRNTSHRFLKQVFRPVGMKRTKTERIDRRTRTASHREHTSLNAADPGCRSFQWIDFRLAVMALHFEDDSLIIANVDTPGSFARPFESLRRFRRKFFQKRF